MLKYGDPIPEEYTYCNYAERTIWIIGRDSIKIVDGVAEFLEESPSPPSWKWGVVIYGRAIGLMEAALLAQEMSSQSST